MKNNILRAFDFFTAFVVVLCFIFSCAGMTAFEAYASTPSITLDKAIVGMGEEIVIRYNGTGSKDWIGIYADGVRLGDTFFAVVLCGTWIGGRFSDRTV